MTDSSTAVLEKKTEPEGESSPYLFVCSGNTCRSPMAAALFNYLFGADGRHAVSAGLVANGSPISSGAVNALRDRGIVPTPDNDYEGHVSRNVTKEDIEKARLVIAVTGFHATRLIMSFPEYATKITVLPEDVEDPYGGSDEEYKACLASMERMMKAVFPPVSGGEEK